MKTKITYLFILALAFPWAVGAQNVYDDDLYYHPKFESALIKAGSTQDQPSLPANKVTENEIVVAVNNNKSSIDVDVYNRRPSYKNNNPADNYKEKDLVEDSVLISGEEYEDFKYCERIRRFHNDKFTTHITEDGYVNIYIEEGADVDIYYMDDYYWNPWMSPWYFDNFYRPYYYGWGYHGYYGYYSPWRYSGWYYGFYDPWYYSWYSPWYSSWGWDYYYYGYHPAYYYYSPYTVWGYPSYIKTPRKPVNTRTALASRNELNSRGGIPVSSRQAVGSRGAAGRADSRSSAVYNDFSRAETTTARATSVRGDNLTRGTVSPGRTTATARSAGTRSTVNSARSSDNNASYRSSTPDNRYSGTGVRQSTTRSSSANSSRSNAVSTTPSSRSGVTTTSPSNSRGSSSSVRSSTSSSVRSGTSSSSTRSSVSTSSSSSSSYSTPSSSGSSSYSSGRSSSSVSSGSAVRSSSGSSGRR
ncbi:MAG TPA: hypothetical protein PLC41_04470 [Bacteroidales bacterium]|jgi:hypothetical protein|nr:hypothetical protein [Bacteroidales bacterium]